MCIYRFPYETCRLTHITNTIEEIRLPEKPNDVTIIE